MPFKNFAVVGDIQQGISLVRWQAERNCLSLISRNTRAADVAAVGLMIDGPQVNFPMFLLSKERLFEKSKKMHQYD